MLIATFDLTMNGHVLDTSPDAFGELQSSIDLLDDVAAMRNRMSEDGYLFLPDYLDVNQVTDARRAVCEKLDALGVLDPAHPIMDAIPRPKAPQFNGMELSRDNPPLLTLLYEGAMRRFYEKFFRGAMAHFDYTWFRAVPPGVGTYPHCDVVYMGRGTQQLFTSWTPIGNATLEDGGLLIMEGSNNARKLRDNYCQLDVDAVCENKQTRDGDRKMQIPTFGRLTDNPVRLRENLDLRWLTADYKAGDLLVFTVHTIHCSLDNHGNRLRLSSDSRYQFAGETQDERWISIDGRPPVAHGDEAKRDMIC